MSIKPIKFEGSPEKPKSTLNALIVGVGPIGSNGVSDYFRDIELKPLFCDNVTGYNVDCVINVDFAPLTEEEKFVLKTRNPMLYDELNCDVYVVCPSCFNKSVLYFRDKITGDISIYCKECHDKHKSSSLLAGPKITINDNLIARLVRSGHFYHGKCKYARETSSYDLNVIEVQNIYTNTKRSFFYLPGKAMIDIFGSFDEALQAAYKFATEKTLTEPV